MLPAKVSIFNIKDAEAFVRANLPRVILTQDGREDLVAEGLRILTEMSRRYEPGRNGQNPLTSSFSAYAKKYLPGKLRDAWHRQEGHTLTAREDGGREWRYPGPAVSLNAMSEGEGAVEVVKLHDGSKMETEDAYYSSLADSVLPALEVLARIENEQALKVGILCSEGFTAGRIAEELKMPVDEVQRSIDRLVQAAPYIQTLEAA